MLVDNPRLPEHLRPVLEKKFQKEMDAGRILGPFDDAPFPNLRVSPIKVAPKKTPLYLWGAQCHVPSSSSSQLRRFLDFFEECRILIAPEKREGPDQKLAFLGITLDVTLSLAVLPDDKLSRCRELLREAMTRKTMTLKALQSLFGHLNFACRVMVPGRAFLQRVYALTQKVQKHYHYVKITKEVRADFETWYHFLSEYNGSLFFSIGCCSHR